MLRLWPIGLIIASVHILNQVDNMEVLVLEKPEVKESISFLWNDVAAMSDDNCTFIICKSMVRLSRGLPDIMSLEKVSVQNIAKAMTRSRAGSAEISGQVDLNVEYETNEGEIAELSFAVPFAGDYRGTAEVSNRPQAVYADAQAVGFNNLLLEIVLSVPNGSRLLRGSEAVIGDFQLQQKITLPPEWPPMEQLLASQVTYTIDDYARSDDELKINGVQTISLLYAANQTAGEKVMFYQTAQNYEANMRTETQLAEDAALNAGYFSMTTHLIDNKEIAINSNCTVRTSFNNIAAKEEIIDTPPVISAETMTAAVDSQSPMTAMESAEDCRIEPKAPDVASTAEDIPTENSVAEPAALSAPTKNSRPHTKGRPSRRDNLLKYMRNLDCGVRTPKCSRNIAFAPKSTPMDQAIEEEQTMENDLPIV